MFAGRPKSALCQSVVMLVALCCAMSLAGSDDYQLGADSMRQAGVPQGTVTKFSWDNSKVFPNTTRSWWVYVPAQYSADKPACVMVFQDGGGYVSTNGSYRAPIVFDNLIHKKEMPVTIGIFINPGDFAAKPGEKPRLRPDGTTNTSPRNRSF